MACWRQMVIVFEMALCWIVLALVVVAREMEATSEQSVSMSKLAGNFGKLMEGCREEAQLTPDILQEWPQIWDYGYNADHREIGCAIICMSNKESLLNKDQQMKNDSLIDYSTNSGLGDTLAVTIVDLYKKCEEQHVDIEDDCSRITKVFGCFKSDAKKAGIAPYVDLIRDVMNEN